MILIDDRIGSKELYPLLKGLDRTLTRLSAGDVAIRGNGPTGPVMIGVERKKLPDLIACMHDGRFTGHQAIGMINSYYRNYLVVEDEAAVDRHGELKVRRGKRWVAASKKGKVTNQQIENFITSVEEMMGFRCRFTKDINATCRFIVALHAWWSKEYDQHTACLTMHRDAGIWSKSPITQQMAQCIDSVGVKRGKEISKYFKNPKAMGNGEVEDWEGIDGIGPNMAKRIHRLMRSG